MVCVCLVWDNLSEKQFRVLYVRSFILNHTFFSNQFVCFYCEQGEELKQIAKIW